MGKNRGGFELKKVLLDIRYMTFETSHSESHSENHLESHLESHVEVIWKVMWKSFKKSFKYLSFNLVCELNESKNYHYISF